MLNVVTVDIHSHVMLPKTFGKAGKYGPDVFVKDEYLVLASAIMSLVSSSMPSAYGEPGVSPRESLRSSRAARSGVSPTWTPQASTSWA